MPLVTVCLPAHRSAAFIAETLRSLQGQTFRDFRVRIGLEPVDAASTVQVCEPFLKDPRFEFAINPERLGWDGNVRALLRTVDTPMFAIQPHDDVLHPGYLEALVGALETRPDATVAYSDAFLFGAQTGIRASDLPNAGRSARVLAFVMGGAEGHPFRGVTRSTVLDRPFPTNPFSGFAAETEWTLHLVQSGVALRTQRPLYLKRARASDSDAVTSGWRFHMDTEELQAGLEHNRAQLLRSIGEADDSDGPRSLVVSACEAAMLRRWQALAGARFGFGQVQLARAQAVLESLEDNPLPQARAIEATVHAAMSRHWHQLGDAVASEREARAAVASDGDHPEACLRLAQALGARGSLPEMVELLCRAAACAPLDVAMLLTASTAARLMAQRYGAAAT